MRGQVDLFLIHINISFVLSISLKDDWKPITSIPEDEDEDDDKKEEIKAACLNQAQLCRLLFFSCLFFPIFLECIVIL